MTSKYLYQYIQKSKLPTDKFQCSLPRLKIPKLDKTYDRYIKALNPVFQNDPRLKNSQDLYKDFICNQGKELHQRLLQYDKSIKHTSYISEFWSDMYLSSRLPLPLNYNPFLAWRQAPLNELNNQLVRSCNFIISAIRFKRSLEENVLEPEIFHLNPKKTAHSSFYKNVMSLAPEAIATYISFAFKAFPLDMSQYKNLFNSTRIPRLGKDEVLKSDPTQNRHILVMKNGEFFIFDVLDKNGDLIAPQAIYANLCYIANQVPSSISSRSISELTTADRDFWAKEREHLINLNEKNKINLEKLDSAIFTLCLDDISFDQNQEVNAAHNFLHGHNANKPLNRWFDKSFSLIVTQQGHSAINFEHSWGDGVAVLRFFNDTFSDSCSNPQISQTLSDIDKSAIKIEKLEFELDNRLQNSIDKCHDEHKTITSNLELGAVKYDKLNRDYFKKYKLSPDSMSQLAFQLAFQKVYNKTPVTYESCSTAAFRGGRTETVRPCTDETNDACKAILLNKKSSTLGDSDLKDLLKKCSTKHFSLCKEASMGDGFDRHLFALKEISIRSDEKLHSFFSDPIHLENQHYTLSTSTLYGESFEGGGFAPVVADGFGLGYGYVDKSFGVLVASYKSHRNNRQFAQALEESLDNIREIVEK